MHGSLNKCRKINDHSALFYSIMVIMFYNFFLCTEMVYNRGQININRSFSSPLSSFFGRLQFLEIKRLTGVVNVVVMQLEDLKSSFSPHVRHIRSLPFFHRLHELRHENNNNLSLYSFCLYHLRERMYTTYTSYGILLMQKIQKRFQFHQNISYWIL